MEEDHNEEEDVRTAFTADALMNEGMNETGIALMADAEESIEEALTVIKDARRTLREARAKQHQVKMNRQYYRPSNDGGKGRGKDGGHKGEIKCFRCGGNHKIANCTDRQAPRGEAKAAEEVAPFVCFHDNLEETECYTVTNPEDRMTTSEAVRQGFGVIDGGATRTLGSVVALASDRGGEGSLRLASQKEGDKGTQLEGSKEDGLLSRGLGLFLEKANKRKGYGKTWNVFGPSKSIGDRDKTQTGWFSGARKLYLVC